MDYPTIWIGIAFIAYGVMVGFLRLRNPDKFRKLAEMQARFGERGGNIVHLLFSAIMPMVFGVIFIIIGIRGGTLF